jgi:Na+/H+ antiporter NhaD/arsenite permease-like protein
MSAFMILVFVIGYCCIIFDRFLKLDKAASAIITGVLCWSILISGTAEKGGILEQLMAHTGDIAAILFFLLGAMTIVELIEAHNGFAVITNLIGGKNARQSQQKLLWIVSFITFFLSSILDNLTTAIIMVMLVRKLVTESKERFLFIGVVVIAANAGGAWSPIGDVTTTMLWTAHRITSWNIIRSVILPSLMNLLVPLVFFTFMIGKNEDKPSKEKEKKELAPLMFENKAILFSGVFLLISIPVFKSVTHLPPFMGMLLALGVLWVITELMHKKKAAEDRYKLSVLSALRKMDMTTILFFLGILLAVSSLQTAGILGSLADSMNRLIGNINVTAIAIGILSAIVDNVPLVAAAIGMYPLSVLPTDHSFWELLAYSAGTGGSILIIGSAAGVAAMGLEKIGFFEYFKKIGWLALIGYFAGAGTYLLQMLLK